jgi:hypothetical protein
MSEELVVLDSFDPHSLHKALVMVVSFSKKSFVTMGKILHELKEGEKWRDAIGGIDTWAAYLKQPEIGLTANEANRLIQIYYHFVIRLGYDEEKISDVPLKSMHYLLPLAKEAESQEQIDGLLEDAISLSQQDFRDRLYDAKADKLGASATRTFEYMVMKKTLETGTMERVPGIDSDTIKETFNL